MKTLEGVVLNLICYAEPYAQKREQYHHTPLQMIVVHGCICMCICVHNLHKLCLCGGLRVHQKQQKARLQQ